MQSAWICVIAKLVIIIIIVRMYGMSDYFYKIKRKVLQSCVRMNTKVLYEKYDTLYLMRNVVATSKFNLMISENKRYQHNLKHYDRVRYPWMWWWAGRKWLLRNSFQCLLRDHFIKGMFWDTIIIILKKQTNVQIILDFKIPRYFWAVLFIRNQ